MLEKSGRTDRKKIQERKGHERENGKKGRMEKTRRKRKAESQYQEKGRNRKDKLDEREKWKRESSKKWRNRSIKQKKGRDRKWKGKRKYIKDIKEGKGKYL